MDEQYFVLIMIKISCDVYHVNIMRKERDTCPEKIWTTWDLNPGPSHC